MPLPHWRGSHRFYVALLWVAIMMMLAAVVVACGGEQSRPVSTPTVAPTATPLTTPTPPATPTEAPTATPLPTPTPTASPSPDSSISTEVEFWELDMSSTGQDMVARLTDEEVTCLRTELGASYQTMLEAPLVGEAGELLEGGAIGPSPQVPCLTPEHQASASISMISIAAGGLSAGTRDCILHLLRDDPAIGAAIGQGDAFDDDQGPGMLRFIACLTPAEVAALTSFQNGEDPPPNPNDISCLIQELEDTSSGERIIAVLSGADTSGEGLTMEDSAVLGQAVEALRHRNRFRLPESIIGNRHYHGGTPAVRNLECRRILLRCLAEGRSTVTIRRYSL